MQALLAKISLTLRPTTVKLKPLLTSFKATETITLYQAAFCNHH